MIITYDQFKGFIALVIKSNKASLIQAMNTSGNPVSIYISDDALFDQVLDIYDEEGLSAVQSILSTVKIDDSKLSSQERVALSNFQKANSDVSNTQAKFTLSSVSNFFGDLVGGSTITGGAVNNQVSTASISPGMLGLIALAGVILIILFRKSIIVVVALIVIILAVVLYGIFGKTVTSTSTGANGISHGGIISALQGVLNGLNIHVGG